MAAAYWFGGALVCILLAQNSNARLTPDFIHPCKEDDAECIKKSAQDAIPEFVKGLPELGVPPLDPFVIEKLQLPLPGLKVSFYNGKVTGFRKCIVEHASTKLKNHRLDMELRCNVTLKGGYDAVGRVLVFPINGEGDAKIKLTNLKIKMNMNTKYVVDDKGARHYAVKDYKYTFDYGDKVTMHLTNLFKDSKELSETVLKFLNENWRQVADEFGKPILDYAVDLTVKTIEKFFLSIPIEELLDGPSIVYE
uniref:Takeout Protein n=1 Tax=Epiphyas postvittana TaxID=65032 RepID=A0A0K8TU33_EPIPO